MKPTPAEAKKLVEEYKAFAVARRAELIENKNLSNSARQRSFLRREYLGLTPGKDSTTGRAVQLRMRQDGLLRDTPTGVQVQASDGAWVPISETDMAHTTDAVKWWNEVGRHYGTKSPEVRQWMLDPKNYRLDSRGINRSKGAKLRHTDSFMPPANERS